MVCLAKIIIWGFLILVGQQGLADGPAQEMKPSRVDFSKTYDLKDKEGQKKFFSDAVNKIKEFEFYAEGYQPEKSPVGDFQKLEFFKNSTLNCLSKIDELGLGHQRTQKAFQKWVFLIEANESFFKSTLMSDVSEVAVHEFLEYEKYYSDTQEIYKIEISKNNFNLFQELLVKIDSTATVLDHSSELYRKLQSLRNILVRASTEAMSGDRPKAYLSALVVYYSFETIYSNLLDYAVTVKGDGAVDNDYTEIMISNETLKKLAQGFSTPGDKEMTVKVKELLKTKKPEDVLRELIP